MIIDIILTVVSVMQMLAIAFLLKKLNRLTEAKTKEIEFTVLNGYYLRNKCDFKKIEYDVENDHNFTKLNGSRHTGRVFYKTNIHEIKANDPVVAYRYTYGSKLEICGCSKNELTNRMLGVPFFYIHINDLNKITFHDNCGPLLKKTVLIDD